MEAAEGAMSTPPLRAEEMTTENRTGVARLDRRRMEEQKEAYAVRLQ